MFSRETKIIFFCCVGHFCIDFMLGIWPVFKTLANLDLARAGLIACVCVAGGEAMQFFFGSLSDKGYSKLLLPMGLCLAISSTLFSQAASYYTLMLLFLVTCLGSSSFHPTAVSVLGSLNVPNRNSVMGLFTAAGMLGLGVSQICFTQTFFCFDGRTDFLAIPVIAFAAFTILFMPKQEAVSTGSSHGFSFSIIKGFFKNKATCALFFAFLGNQLMMWAFIFLLPDFLKLRDVSSWIIFGGGHFCFMFGATLAPPVWGYLADRTSVRKVLFSVSLVSVSVFYTVLFSSQVSEFVALILLFLQGALLGGISPLVWSYGTKLVPEHRGLISAFLMGFVWILSEAFGVGLTGALADFFGENGPVKSLFCMGLFGFPALYFAYLLPEKEKAVL